MLLVPKTEFTHYVNLTVTTWEISDIMNGIILSSAKLKQTLNHHYIIK